MSFFSLHAVSQIKSHDLLAHIHCTDMSLSNNANKYLKKKAMLSKLEQKNIIKYSENQMHDLDLSADCNSVALHHLWCADVKSESADVHKMSAVTSCDVNEAHYAKQIKMWGTFLTMFAAVKATCVFSEISISQNNLQTSCFSNIFSWQILSLPHT